MAQIKSSIRNLCIAISAASAGAAWAQTESVKGLEEVFVTAERVTASQQDTPISLSTFDQRKIENLGVVESGDIAIYTPNLRMQKTPASQNSYGVSIRGIGSAEPSLAQDPTVGIYVDGVYMGRNSAAAFEVVDMERIEVLRGPQGTLYGRNTIGGAVNIVTQKPSGTFGFQQKFTVGERDLFRSSTSIDTEERANLSAKLSYTHGERGGLARSAYNGGELGQYDQQAWRAAIRWTPLDNVVVDYTYDHFQQDSNTNLSQISYVRPLQLSLGGAQYQQAQLASSPNRKGQLPFLGTDKDQSMEIDGHALTLAWEHDSYTLKSISSFREFTNRYASQGFGQFPSDGGSLLDANTFMPIPAGEYVQMFDSAGYNEHEQWSQEFQVTGQAMSDRLSYTAGVYFFNEKGEQADPQRFVYPIGGATSIVLESGANFYSTDNEALAAYGQFKYALTDQWSTTLGMRWSEDEKSTTMTTTFDDVGDSTQTASNKWSNFNPDLTVTYTPTDDMMGYARLATGYRSGGYNIRATTVTSFQKPVNEESVTSFEMGGKSEWLDNRLRLNGAVFYYEYEDQQVAQFEAGSGGASSSLVNAGESTAWGTEIELTAMPIESLLITLNYGYIDVTFEEFVTNVSDVETGLPVLDGNSDPVTRDISDTASTIANGPKTSASAIVEYSFPAQSYGRWVAQLDASYSGKRTFQTQMNRYDASDAYTLVNARLTLGDIPVSHGELSLAAWGKNLGNREIREYGVDFGQLGYAVNTYRELRSVGFDLTYNY